MRPQTVCLKPLTARRELEVPARARALLPFLLKRGLEAGDAWALACNTCLLHAAWAGGPAAPVQLLDIFSLRQIAALAKAADELDRELEWEVESR